MTLPHGFDTPFEYFQQTLAFLRQYSWLYKEANTCYVRANILVQMPQQFHKYFEELDNDQLHLFPLVHQPLDLFHQPEVNQFRQQLAKLIPTEAFNEPPDCNINYKVFNFKKINMKKQHEIQRLATAIHQQLMHGPSARYCQIDFGCGLGYLSECLYRLNENFLILGLESDLYRVEAAKKRLLTFLPQATGAIDYKQQFITETSRQFISKSAQELFQFNYDETNATTTTATTTQNTLVALRSQNQQPIKLAIIGLHACADLTITSMKLFLEMPDVRHLIIMPCCYHKLQMCESTLKFKNFPLSQCLKDAVAASDTINNYVAYLNRPFLRLACQQTLKRWCKCSAEQHATHGRAMFLRAVAEALKEETEVVVKRKKPMADVCSSKDVEFEIFSQLFELKEKANDNRVQWREIHKRKFYSIMEKYPNGEKLAEGLTCLQTSMQKLCENLVLYDRLCYMMEAASNLNLSINVRYEKLMDEDLSPRCYVLIAEKL